jgi:hypothetical protein
MKNAAPRPGHELTLDAMPPRPYSRAHDQRRDHCHRSPPPQFCGMGGFARLKSAPAAGSDPRHFLTSSAI